MPEPQKPLFPESLKRFLIAVDRLVLKLAANPVQGIFFALILAFFLHGVRSEATDYFTVSQAPFQPLQNGASYVQDALFLPLTAYYLGLNHSQIQFDFYAFCAYVLAFIAIYVLGYRRFKPEALFFLALAVVFSPVSLNALGWLGRPDSFTILFSVIAALSNAIPILFIAAILGVFNHPMFLVIGTAIAILRSVSGEKSFKVFHVFAILAGIAIGYGLVQAFLGYHQIEIHPNRIEFILEREVSFWLEAKFIELPLSLPSLYQGLWLVLPVYFLYGFSGKRTYYLVFLVLQLAAGLVTLFVLDTTRVFSLLTLGMILHLVGFTYQSVEEKYHQSMRWLLIAAFWGALFIPRYLVMFGDTYTSSNASIPHLILSLLLGWQ